MNEFICENCKKVYESDGLSKPFKFKNNVVTKYYKSSRFCSIECAEELRKKKFQQTMSKPEFKKRLSEKVKTVWKNRTKEEIDKIHTKIQNSRDVDKFRKSFHKTIQNRTKEDSKRIHENYSKAQNSYSKERREEINDKIRKTKHKNIDVFKDSIRKMKLTKANKTPEEKAEIQRKRKLTWETKTPEEKREIKEREIQTKKRWSPEYRENFSKCISNSLKDFHKNYPEKIEEMRKRNKQIFNSNQELIDHIKEKGSETKLRHFKTAFKMSTDDFKNQFKNDKKEFQKYLEDLYQKMIRKEIIISGHSPDEIKLYRSLLDIFEVDEIEFPFKLDKYEYDFYVKPLNTVVELNIFPTHGDKLFDENSKEDLKERQRLIDDFDNLNYIEKIKLVIWANWDRKNNCIYKGSSDVNKRNIVLNKGLKFKALYNTKEIEEFLNYLSNPTSELAQ